MIYLLINYSRSGGTLLSKIIASQKNVVFLSEVNPNHNAVYSPAKQANLWYNFKIDERLDFKNQIEAIYKICQKTDKFLIIRDFTFIDFTPHQLNNFKPSLQFSNLKLLEEIAPTKSIAFVRNGIDVWISRDCPPKFSEGYLDYIKLLIEGEIPIFKYEDLTYDPNNFLKQISEKWEIPTMSFQPKMLKNNKVTGDNQLQKPSRGSKQNALKPLKRKQISIQLIQHLHQDEKLLKANNLLNYSSSYSENLESSNNQNWLNFKHLIRKIKGSYPSAEY